MTSFALAIFLGAFLLFQVQPLMGRFIVPWFGGASSVWNTCLLFFQVCLLAGYGYAHWLSQRPSRRLQGWLHFGLLAASLVLLPITPGHEWKPAPDGEPVGQILLLLLGTVGVPFILLSSTGPLMQHWFARSEPGRSPYRLYALSNAASLLALLSYPTILEPRVALDGQATLWSLGYGLFVLASGWCAVKLVARVRQDEPPPIAAVAAARAANPEPAAPVAFRTLMLWLGLAAAGSALLMATTNQLTQEVASVPFLWVLPLATYLLTFVICFDREDWYDRRVFGPLLAVMATLALALLAAGTTATFRDQLIVYLGLLFAGCMSCHGELVRMRPGPRHLTLFYLMVALGGTVGGVFVTIAAPLLFNGFYELHVALGAAALLTLVSGLRDRRATPSPMLLAASGVMAIGALLLSGSIAVTADVSASTGGWVEVGRRAGVLWDREWFRLMLAGSAGVVVVVAALRDLARARAGEHPRWYRGALWYGAGVMGLLLVVDAAIGEPDTIHEERSFYGALRVAERRDPLGTLRVLISGRIAHGRQYQGVIERLRPIAYYDSASGVGMALTQLVREAEAEHPPRGLHVGVVGLGAGTLAAYGRPGDRYRFYELDPAVERVARQYFTYLQDSRASVEVALGDGRLRLEQELHEQGSQGFDLLVVDAFTSDAIPVHLLTEQCAALYLRHLQPNGVILFHVSNRFVNLRPVIRGLAKRFRLRGLWLVHGGQVARGVLGSSWMMVGRAGNPLFDVKRLADSASAFPTVRRTIPEAASQLNLSEADVERLISAGAIPVFSDSVRTVLIETDPRPVLWTDDRSSLWPLIRFY